MGSTGENKVQKYILTVNAAIVSEILTFPLDITKTRLQLQNELNINQVLKTQIQYRGTVRTALGILREEGISGIYAGLPPALLRHVVYSGIRIGLYEQIKDIVKGDSDHFSLWKKIVAGAASGAIGQLIASPTDLVKVRLQAQRRNMLQTKLLGKEPVVKYTGTFHAFSTIYKEEGFVKLWRGVAPNVYRAALVNLGELATYDQSKEWLVKSNLLGGDNLISQSFAGLASGLAATITSCPADVVKTRMMNQAADQKLYINSLDCLIKSVKAEGVLALYKGFFPTWARLGPWQLCFWITYEQLRVLTGMKAF